MCSIIERERERGCCLNQQHMHAHTCNEGDTEVNQEEDLQHEVAALVHDNSSDNADDCHAKVLDGLHAAGVNSMF